MFSTGQTALNDRSRRPLCVGKYSVCYRDRTTLINRFTFIHGMHGTFFRRPCQWEVCHTCGALDSFGAPEQRSARRKWAANTITSEWSALAIDYDKRRSSSTNVAQKVFALAVAAENARQQAIAAELNVPATILISMFQLVAAGVAILVLRTQKTRSLRFSFCYCFS
jgi:hypothetical protein